MSMMLSTVNVLQLGLTISEDATAEQLEQAGDDVRTIVNNMQWHFGDILNHLESKFGHKYAIATERWGLNLNTARQYARVARAFPLCNRLHISWTHHHAAAAIEDVTTRQQLLVAAMNNNWPVSKLKDEVKIRLAPSLTAAMRPPRAVPDINQILPLYPEFNGLHPACEAMPLMTEQEFGGLVLSIQNHGMYHPILRSFDGLLVDGKHRLMACHLTGTAIGIQDLAEGEDGWSWCYSRNVLRASYTDEQVEHFYREMLAIQLKQAAGEVAE